MGELLKAVELQVQGSRSRVPFNAKQGPWSSERQGSCSSGAFSLGQNEFQAVQIWSFFLLSAYL